MKKIDIFDIIQPDQPDSFDEVENEDSAIENLKRQFSELLEKFDGRERKKMTAEVKEYIRQEIAKIKPVQKVIQKTVERVEPIHLEPKVVEVPPQIIRETRVEVPVQKADDGKLAELIKVSQQQAKQIEDLKKELEKVREMADHPIFVPGGSGVIGIPPPEPNEGKTLKVVNGKAAWVTVTGGGGASISGYTVNDTTELKNLPADASLDDIRQVLGSLIQDLQA